MDHAAPRRCRLADVTRVAERTRLAGALAADTHLVTLADRRRVVHKRGHDDDPDWVRRQADAEIPTAAVAQTVGAPASPR